MIVERLTHKDIGAAVTELVIRPRTCATRTRRRPGSGGSPGRHAHNYTVDEADPAGPLVDVTEFEPSWAGASGATVSTPSDLNRFCQELLGGRLLPRWALTRMRTVVPVPGLGRGVGYGLGLIRLPLSCGGHMGDLAGGGVADVSGQDGSGRAATVYITATTGGAAVEHMRRTMNVALVPGRGSSPARHR